MNQFSLFENIAIKEQYDAVKVVTNGGLIFFQEFQFENGKSKKILGQAFIVFYSLLGK